MKKKLLIPLVAGAFVVCSSAFVMSSCKKKEPEAPNITYEQGDAIIEDKDVQYEYDANGNVLQYTANGKLLNVKYLVKDGSNSYVELRGEKPEEMVVINATNGITKFDLKEIEDSLTLNEKKVSVCAIASGAFKNCTTLQEVDLTKTNDSLTFNIGSRAFEGCPNLTKVTLPENIYSEDNVIGSYAFASCESLTEINISEKFSSVGAYAFKACLALTSVSLPSKVEVIETGVFSDCDKLSSFSASGTLKSIKADAFADSGLTSVDLSKYSNLHYIGERAFYGTKASRIFVPASVTYIGTGAFQQIKDLNTVEIPFLGSSVATTAYDNWRFANTYGYNQSGVPEDERIERNVSVKVTAAHAILGGAFNGSDDVHSVNVSAYLTDGRYNVYTSDGNTIEDRYEIKVNKDIPASAFEGCTKLQTVSVPDGAKSIGEKAFYGCKSLSSYTIPSTVQKIGAYAFGGTALTSATIPSTVYELGEGLFGNCTALQSLTVEKAFGEMPAENKEEPFFEFTGVNMFAVPYGTNKNLETYEAQGGYVPVSLTSVTYKHVSVLDSNAFDGYKSLTNATVEFAPAADMPDVEDMRQNLLSNGVQEITVDSINYDTQFASADIIEKFVQANMLDKDIFFDGRMHNVISSAAFRGCENLSNITLTNTNDITAIGNQAFKNCKQLETFTIPETVIAIGGQAFYGCRALTSVTIPASVESLGTQLLGDCLNLSSLTIEQYNSIVENTVTGSTLSTKSLNTLINGNLGVLFATKANSDYITEWEEQNQESYTETESFYTKKLYAVGNSTSTTYYVPASLTTVTLKNVAQVSDSALYGWKELTTVNLEFVENQLTGKRINNSGSSFTPSTETVYYNNVIGGSAFYGCKALDTLNVTNATSVTGIGENAFNGCAKIDKADFEKFANVNAISYMAFANTGISGEVTIPATVNSLGKNVFYGCPDITGITIKDYDKSINGENYYDNSGYPYSSSMLIKSYLERYAISYDNTPTPVSFTSITSYAGVIENLFGGVNDTTSSYYAKPQYYSARNVNVPLKLKSVTLEEVGLFANYALYNMSSVETLKIGKTFEKIFDNTNTYALKNMSGLKTLNYEFSYYEYNTSSYNYLSGCTSLESVKVKLPTSSGTANISNLFGGTNSMPVSLRTVNVVGAAEYYIPQNFLYNCQYVTELKISANATIKGVGNNALTGSHVPMTVHTLTADGNTYTATVFENCLIAANGVYNSSAGGYYYYVPANVTCIADGVFSTSYNTIFIYYDGTDWANVSHSYSGYDLSTKAMPESVEKTEAAKEYPFRLVSTGSTSSYDVPSSINGPSVYSAYSVVTRRVYAFGSGKIDFTYTLNADSTDAKFYVNVYNADGTVKKSIHSGKIANYDTYKTDTITGLVLEEGDYIEMSIEKDRFDGSSSINLTNITEVKEQPTEKPADPVGGDPAKNPVG